MAARTWTRVLVCGVAPAAAVAGCGLLPSGDEIYCEQEAKERHGTVAGALGPATPILTWNAAAQRYYEACLPRVKAERDARIRAAQPQAPPAAEPRRRR